MKNKCEHKYIILADVVRTYLSRNDQVIGARMVCEKCLDMKVIKFDELEDKEAKQ